MDVSVVLQSLVFSMAIGSLGSAIVYLGYLVKNLIWRSMLTQITISNSDPCYKWLLNFLIKKDYLNQTMNDCIVKIAKKKKNWYEPKQQKKKPKVEYYPAPGSHSFTYKGK